MNTYSSLPPPPWVVGVIRARAVSNGHVEAAHLPARDLPDIRQLAAPSFHEPGYAGRGLRQSVVYSPADDVLASFAVRLADPVLPHTLSAEARRVPFGEQPIPLMT